MMIVFLKKDIILVGSTTRQDCPCNPPLHVGQRGQEFELKVVSVGRDDHVLAVGVIGCTSCAAVRIL